jgi:hypothetical protein
MCTLLLVVASMLLACSVLQAHHGIWQRLLAKV